MSDGVGSGVVMIHTDQPTWDRWSETGEWVLFRAAHSRLGPDGKFDWLAPHEFVEWAKPCETCEGRGCFDNPGADGRMYYPKCEMCLDGKRRIAVMVETFDPHPYSEQSGRARLSRRRRVGEELILREMSGQWFTGRLVTVGHVVVEWGPLVVVDVSPREGGHVVLRRMWAGTHWDYRLIRLDHGVWQELTLPPDIDPATLVGQYALGGKVVTP